MTYDSSAKRASQKYIREKQREVKLRYKKDEYEHQILPAIKKTGLPVATFIKMAVAEKLHAQEMKEEARREILERVRTAVLEEVPAVFSGDCRQILLFGPYARGDQSPESDVDIAILVDRDWDEIRQNDRQLDRAATKIGLRTMAVVSFVCLPFREFEEEKDWNPFYRRIVKDGILWYEG